MQDFLGPEFEHPLADGADVELGDEGPTVRGRHVVHDVLKEEQERELLLWFKTLSYISHNFTVNVWTVFPQ